MQNILKKEKKYIYISMLFVGIFVLIDILVKLWITRFDFRNIGRCDGSNNFIHYHPVYNEKGSYINLVANLQYNRIIFLIIAFAGVLFGFFLLIYILNRKQKYGYNAVVVVPEIFFIAACLGRFIERIRGFYTLDYIAIKNIGILDLLDVFFVLGCVGLIFVTAHIQYKEKNNK